MADGDFVRTGEYLLDVHGQLRSRAMQHLQHVHNFVCPSLQHLLDVQFMSTKLFDLFELLGRSRRNSGIIPGITSTGLLELLSEHRRASDDLRGTDTNRKGTEPGGTFRTGERGPCYTSAEFAQHGDPGQRAEASNRESAGECHTSGERSTGHLGRARQEQPLLRAKKRWLYVFRGTATVQPE